jgi:hypothetical protein
MDQSNPVVYGEASVRMAYTVFMTLYLRHLPVGLSSPQAPSHSQVDGGNNVVGMISRKDLMDFVMEDRLRRHVRHEKGAPLVRNSIEMSKIVYH